MTVKRNGCLAFAAALAFCGALRAQEGERGPTLDERIGTLERQVAVLDTRLAARTAQDDGAALERGVPLDVRIDDLERSLARLIADVERIERQSESALREATQARQDAATAAQLARDTSRLR